MERFDREIQNEILSACVSTYPSPPDYIAFLKPKIATLLENDLNHSILANLYYLREHGLISFNDSCNPEPFSIFDEMTATARGIDFMLDDGGLSAILNVQTIKFHREAVVVLEDLIALSNMSEEQKEKAKSTIGEMSAEALKAVVQAATSAGISMLFGK